MAAGACRYYTTLLGCSGMVLPAAGDIWSLRIGAPSTPFLYQTLFLHIPTGHLRHPPLSVLCERKSLIVPVMAACVPHTTIEGRCLCCVRIRPFRETVCWWFHA